ncbi:MAG: hypothetical protein H6602_05230 [Flavobacteriales bacterium]|nr:hypothetical protein [Flavobacteriales bacterium]MCB9191044.1 hypothetical protein [Flavobacteriales bacterium]
MRKHYFAGIAALFLGAVMLTISGCYKETFDFNDMKEDFITWEPDIAFPIVWSTLDAEEIISVSDSTNIYQYDPDNFITLIYRKRIFSRTVNDFFQFPVSQTLNQGMSLTPVETTTFTTTGSVSKTVNTGLTFGLSGPGGSQLDKVVFQEGFMRIAFTSNFEHSGNLEVSMPELRLNGSPFFQTYQINYQGGVVNVEILIPLDGYEMDLDNGNGPNTIPISYTLNLTQGGGATPIPSHQVQINHSFENMVIAFADGNFGNFTLEVDPAEVDLDVVQSEHGGNIYFEDPRFRLRITNTIGAEVAVSLDEFYATGGPNPDVDIDLSALISGNMFTIPAAPAVGDSAVLEYYFTKNNSNIATIVNSEYGEVYHDVSGEVNPNGPAYNFAQLNSALEVVADVELPFWGYSDHFTIIDTLEVPFDEAADFADNIERGLLRINTVSHFPVDGILKLYFADSLYNVIDSVLTDGSFIIRSGEVVETAPFDGNTFRVVAPTQTNNDIELDTDKINHLFESKYLLLAADITSTNDAGHNIKVFLEDFIEVRIGLRVKLKADPTVIDDF